MFRGAVRRMGLRRDPLRAEMARERIAVPIDKFLLRKVAHHRQQPA
jgi:hypothetical protein